LKNFLPEQFIDSELLLRAVRSWPRFWDGDKLSSSALKDKNGLSVERTYDRSLEDSIRYMHGHLSGSIVTFTLDACRSVEAIVKYLPEHNIYHCEIHGSNERAVLNSRQAKELALTAEVVFRATISTV